MSKSIRNLIRATAIMAALVVVFAEKNAGATTHMVEFGGSLGFVYSPNSFSAVVGDTVMWMGDFSIHPLSSTTIPANATSWNVTSGNSFSYVIKVPGTYHYQCDVHFSIGMTGTFTALASGVIDPFNSLKQGVGVSTIATIIRPGRSVIKLTVPSTQFVTLQIFDLRGNIVSTLFSRMAAVGTHLVEIDQRFRTDGLFILKLSGNGPNSSRILHFIE